MLLAQLLWVAAAQWPLLFVLAAMSIGSPQRVAERFNDWWLRTAPGRYHALNIVAAVLLILLAIDAGHYVSDHHYLVLNDLRHHR